VVAGTMGLARERADVSRQATPIERALALLLDGGWCAIPRWFEIHGRRGQPDALPAGVPVE
jgi:hypothetical protein